MYSIWYLPMSVCILSPDSIPSIGDIYPCCWFVYLRLVSLSWSIWDTTIPSYWLSIAMPYWLCWQLSLHLCSLRIYRLSKANFINTVAASCFGVLLIHANSNAMRQWLWCDTLRNVEYLDSPYCALHAITSVLVIYIICTLIDMIRIRFIERPFFNSAFYRLIDDKINRLLGIIWWLLIPNILQIILLKVS